MSSARSFYHDFPEDDDFIQCTPCFEENKVHKYRKSTSSTTLRTHLIQKHSIDPDSPEYMELTKVSGEETTASSSEPLVIFDPEVIVRAQKITEVKTRKVRTYFFRLENEETSTCAYCIVDGVKKSYKSTTSTSGLRRHLISAHQVDPLGFFRREDGSEITLNDEQLAESIAGTNKAKESDVWKYFCRKEVVKDDATVTTDEDYVYCSFCWNAPVRQIHKYKNSTSSAALKRHLAARHGLNIEKRRYRASDKAAAETSETLEATNEGENENEIYIEELEILPEATPKTITALSQPPMVKPKKIPKYCRSCGNKDAGFFTKFTALFDDADTREDEQQVSLADLFYEVTGIIVNPDDGMSQCICYICEANLKLSYKFRKGALETEAAMMRKLNLDQQQDEIDADYEVLDEAYLEVEQAAASVKRPRDESEIVFHVQPTPERHKRPRDKRIITVIPKYKVEKQETVEYDDGANEEYEEGYEVQIENEEPLQEYDIIEDESEHVVSKRKNFVNVLWKPGAKKGMTGRKRKISDV